MESQQTLEYLVKKKKKNTTTMLTRFNFIYNIIIQLALIKYTFRGQSEVAIP